MEQRHPGMEQRHQGMARKQQPNKIDSARFPKQRSRSKRDARARQSASGQQVEEEADKVI